MALNWVPDLQGQEGQRSPGMGHLGDPGQQSSTEGGFVPPQDIWPCPKAFSAVTNRGGSACHPVSRDQRCC